MRRRALIAGVLVAAGVLALVLHRSSSSDAMYRLDAVFDSGRGVLPGGHVKIAGADVGVIDEIRLTRGRKALVQMRIDRRFAPFRSDAHCSIRGEGLIGAAVVNCQPGTPAGAPLPSGEGGHPTVPLTQTSIPVNITDFFDIWRVPVRDRLRIVLNELGITLAGRGEDLNDLLRRANPALAKARRVLAIVDGQRHELARSITQSDRALRALAQDGRATRRFVAEASRTSALTAAHERAIGAGIAGLPPLLRRSTTALQRLDALSRTSVPLLSDLRGAAPALADLTNDTPGFSDRALPSVRALDPALRQANRTARQLGPFVADLGRFTAPAVPAARLQRDLQVSLRDSGTYESLLRLFYAGASSTSRYDAVSHLDPSHLVVSSCATYASEHDDACDFHYVRQTAPTRARRRAPAHRRPAAPTPAVTAPSTPAARAPATPALPSLPPVDDAQRAIDGLLTYLLGR